jgi:AbiTii
MQHWRRTSKGVNNLRGLLPQIAESSEMLSIIAHSAGGARLSSQSSVVEMRQAATDSAVRVIDLLRKSKVIATKLQLPEALAWINAEIDGYANEEDVVLPVYRKLSGELRGFNPYRGWETVRVSDPEIAEILSQAPLGQALGAIEESIQKVRTSSRGTFAFVMSPGRKARLLNAISGADDIQLVLSESSLFGIVDAVRHLILNWSLELECNGIVGDGVNFDPVERKEARIVTHQYFIQNVGVVGNVSDKAKVENHQSAHIVTGSDGWSNALGQIKAAMPSLPQPLQSDLAPAISAIENELASPSPQPSRLKTFAESAIRTCEGAAGNLIAAGIGVLLAKLTAM